jgi:hypothetical protein
MLLFFNFIIVFLVSECCEILKKTLTYGSEYINFLTACQSLSKHQVDCVIFLILVR